MTGTRSNPGAGFALERMGFVIGSPRGSLYPSRYTPISAIEASILPPGKLSSSPAPGCVAHAGVVRPVVLLVSFPSPSPVCPPRR